MKIPHRLIALRTYSARDFAEPDLVPLHEAGIPAYLSVRSEDVLELRVPEPDVERARDLLGEEIPHDDILKTAWAEKREEPLVCPRCGSRHVQAGRPVALFVLLAGGVLVGLALQQSVGGVAASVIGLVIALRLAADRFPRWRCGLCAHAWNDYDPLVRGE